MKPYENLLLDIRKAFQTLAQVNSRYADDSETAIKGVLSALRNLETVILDPPEPEIPHPADPVSRWERALIDLEDDKPTGAWGMSDATAKTQLGLPGGIHASRSIVDINTRRLPPDGYFRRADQAARAHGIPTAVLLAIFCRESHHGHALDKKGEGDRGWAFGVGQVDKRYHKQAGRPDPYSLDHMLQAASILAGMRDSIMQKHQWSDSHILKGACVAYNSGVKNVATIEGMDRGTTGNDYGADVMARAKYYQEILDRKEV